ncbi:hypothetical protein SAMN05421823_101384 [Catalinimonas alkaloidigena]|uniref:Uncharacterized protein n=1 Tax=Catalinimonas alkaloidigena TaxID=1075417 RepID=A0A1G8XK32_9BACT|nr:hypothetical protein SAMN05421823_101384 [Catalinimonas alkaloidigena]
MRQTLRLHNRGRNSGKSLLEKIIDEKQKTIVMQYYKVQYWKRYAKELEGIVDGLENELIGYENATLLENRCN